jgi:hypothetical protein
LKGSGIRKGLILFFGNEDRILPLPFYRLGIKISPWQVYHNTKIEAKSICWGIAYTDNPEKVDAPVKHLSIEAGNRLAEKKDF